MGRQTDRGGQNRQSGQTGRVAGRRADSDKDKETDKPTDGQRKQIKMKDKQAIMDRQTKRDTE